MIYFFKTNNFSKKYIPFNLYRECISNYISNKIIYKNFNELNNNDILIIFMYDIIHLNKLNELLKYNNKIFIINTEYYKFKITLNIYKAIERKKNINLLEYNVLNIKYINNNLKNLNYTFLPLLYNPSLNFITHNNYIPFKKRKNDIAFCGSVAPKFVKRYNLLNKLKKKFNIKIVRHALDINLYNKELLNTKIVINIYSNEYNKIFDYYRNTYLLANKCLFISEYPDNIDLGIEKNLIGFDKHLIFFNEENIENTLNKYLKLNNHEYDELVNKQYNWFVKQNNMDDYLKKIL
jgi:hypothetical protein